MTWKQNALICMIGIIISMIMPLWSQYLDWARQYDGPTQSMDYGRAIAVDRDNNVYVTGYSNSTNYDDITTVKYDKDGTPIWVTRFDDPTLHFTDQAEDISVDPWGYIYVTGSSYHTINSNTFDYVTLKYNGSGGDPLWIRYCDASGNDEVVGHTQDASGNIFVTGRSFNYGYADDYMTVAYASNGDELWNQPARYDNGNYDVPTAIINDAASVYVTGYSENELSYDDDYATIKYAKSTGAPIWTKRYDNGDDDEAYGIATNSDGYVYVTGLSQRQIDLITNDDCLTVIYDVDGNYVDEWRYDYNGNEDAAYAIAIDSDDNIYIAGKTGSEGLIVKYLPDGSIPNGWPQRYSNCEFRKIAIDPFGNIVATGTFWGSSPDIITVIYDAGGGGPTALVYDNPAATDDISADMAMDHDGNICIVGHCYTPSNGTDYLTLKYTYGLVSDLPDATAYNWGRHMIRDPFSNTLHLAYHCSQGIRYTSCPCDLNWTHPQVIDLSGKYPTVGLAPNLIMQYDPWLIYIDGDNRVQCRWLNAGSWEGGLVRDNTDGENGPPSLVTPGGCGGNLLVPVRSTSPAFSKIMFYVLDKTGPPMDSAVLDQSNQTNSIWQPCIAYDGNYNLHCVWQKDGDIVYRSRIDGTWNPPLNDPPYSVYPTPNLSATPFIEVYGDYLSVVWSEEETANDPDSREIWRCRKIISVGWGTPGRLYQTSDHPSESPVNAGEDCTVWCENELTGNDFDIARYSDADDFSWISQDATREYYCHSQIQRDYSPWDLYTAWTIGDAAPYRIATSHNQWYITEPGFLELYSVEIGDSTSSTFCLSRDAAIQYSGHKVDYGKNKVAYDLPFLDPAYPAHVLKGILYFEGSGTKVHRLVVNGIEKANLKVKDGQPYEFELPIPNDDYRNNHKLTLQITSPNNDGVYLAGLKVKRLTNAAGIPGGSQAYGDNDFDKQSAIQIHPNPTRDNALIKYCLGLNTTSRISIFDATGRRVKIFSDLRADNQSHTVSWDGRDDQGCPVAPGIYFVREGENPRGESVKLLILK